MNWDNYVYPVDMYYNRTILKNMIDRIKIWPVYSPDLGNTILDHKDILFPINLEAYRIKSLLLESTLFSFSWVPPMSETGYHSDSNRGCTLILPIDDIPHLIKFYDHREFYEYYYSTPILTNGKTIHNGINNTDHNRFNLLFHFDKPFDYVVKLIKNDTLVSKWTQMYPIKSNIDNAVLRNYFNLTANADVCINYVNGGISINNSQTIEYTSANDFDVCQAIKYMLDNPNVKRIELE